VSLAAPDGIGGNGTRELVATCRPTAGVSVRRERTGHPSWNMMNGGRGVMNQMDSCSLLRSKDVFSTGLSLAGHASP
jgi:hypothetical protein